MIEIGSILLARVYRAEPYGVFLHCENADLFVRVQELSWTEYSPANNRGLLDSLLRVQVIARHPQKDQWIASVKRCPPEVNPYLEVAKLPVGAIVTGEIVHKSSEDIFIRLENGARGIIPRSDVNREMRIGDHVEAIVVTLDAESGKLKLRLKD